MDKYAIIVRMNTQTASTCVKTVPQAVYFKSNIDTAAKPRREMLDGVDHLVVPVIAAQEMVMNGFFYPAEEFQGWEDTWNGVPTPVRHPQVNGMPISARSPRIHEQNNIGWFYNVTFTDDKKLKGEIWINTEKAAKVNASYIVERLESGEIMEVSTGLFSNVEMISGEFNGEKYEGVIRHIRPDHLALLPDEIGACSVEDGCGAMRNNCAEDNKGCQCGGTCKDQKKINKAVRLVAEKLGLTSNKESFFRIFDLVVNKLSQNMPDHYIYLVDIYDNKVIYEVDPKNGNADRGKIYERSYVIENDEVVLGDDTQEVVRKTSYSPVVQNSKLVTNGGNNVDKEQMIQAVIANTSNAFTEADKETLQSFSEEVLEKMTANTEEEAPATEEQSVEAPSVEAPATEETPSEEPAVAEQEEAPAEPSVNSILESIKDNDLKEYFESAVAEFQTNKETLVGQIVANSEFEKEEIEKMSFNQIKKLANSVKPASFKGRGAAVTGNSAQPKQAPGLLDVIQNSKKESK